MNAQPVVSSKDEEAPEAFFGLPQQVRFCKKCVISNQRPNSAVEYSHGVSSVKSTIAFDEEGVCDACRFTERKNSEIDWAEREDELYELARRFEGLPGKYNCLVPGSGGKDSFYQAHILKNKFGFRPLTVTWAPHMYTEWGWRNFQAWIHAGFDNILVTPNGLVHRLLTRLAVDNLFHPFQPFMLGQKGMAPRLAAQFDIPLVFFGENEAEYGNPIADTEISTRDDKYFSAKSDDEILLSGVPVAELLGRYRLPRYELQQYLPINAGQLAKTSIEVHYLGYYIRWHPQSAYYYAVEHGGFEPSPERTPGTYSKYNSIDDKIDDLHYWTTHVKFGIGRATYDAAQEIRSEDITREEGVALVRRFDGEWPSRFEDDLMRYLSVDPRLGDAVLSQFGEPEMTKPSFLSLADNFRSPHLWVKSGGDWQLRHQVG
jgi:N-acetyl sugar amidotransferase